MRRILRRFDRKVRYTQENSREFRFPYTPVDARLAQFLTSAVNPTRGRPMATSLPEKPRRLDDPTPGRPLQETVLPPADTISPSTRPEFSLSPGSRPLPEYELVRLLGRGGYGEVWQATGPGGFDLALKFIRLGEKAGEAELRSLALMKNVRHPHLLPMFGAWQRDEYLIIAMELADGTVIDRLEDARRRGQPGLPRDELLAYLGEAAKGIDFLNDYRSPSELTDAPGIQHKDIKPQNLLLVGGSVKVADFGLAKLLKNATASVSGGLTVAYAPPEFFNSQVTRWSDQYSLAVSYCQLRGGRLPYEGAPVELIAAQMTRPPDLSMLPEHERPAVARALAKVPQERWPTCRAFADALAAALPKAAATSPKPPAAATKPKSPKKTDVPPPAAKTRPPQTVVPRRSPALALGVVAAIACFGVGLAFVASRSKHSAAPPTQGLRLPPIDAVVLQPQQRRTLAVPLERGRVSGPVELRLENVPKGVHVWTHPVPDGLAEARIEFNVLRDADRSLRKARLTAAAAGETAVQEFDLGVGPPRDAAELEADLSAAVRQRPADAVAYLNRAHHYQAQKNYRRALSDYTKAAQLEPNYPSGSLGRGDAEHGLGEFDKAVGAFTEALRLDPNLAAAHAARGRAYDAKKDFKRALADCAEAVRLDPDRYRGIYRTRGDFFSRRKEYDRALTYYTEAVRHDPKDALAYRARGIVYENKKDYGRAIPDYTKAIELDPASAAARRDRGDVYLAKKDYDRAIADYTEAVRLDPKDAHAFQARAAAYGNKGDFDHAIGDYTKAIELKPNNAEAYNERGICHDEKKDYDKAIADFSQAIKLNPKFAAAYTNLGNARLAKKQYKRAVANFTKAIEHDKDNALAYFNRSLAYRAMGEAKKADADRAKAVKLDPSLKNK